MTPILLALAAFAAPQAAPAPASDQALSQRCLADVRADAEKAVATANDWRMRGGGWLARQCLGLAYSSLGRWEPAATAFDQAAAEAEVKRDPHHADLLVQGGNSWLAAGDPVKARKDFDAALALGSLANELRGEVLLDRARAGVMASDLPGARIDIDKALALVPADPFGWYLSAALARREGKLERAKTDIAKAVELGGDDAAVLLEAGNIAGVAGDVDAAKGLYARAIRAAPESEAAKSAQAALTANAAPQP